MISSPRSDHILDNLPFQEGKEEKVAAQIRCPRRSEIRIFLDS